MTPTMSEMSSQTKITVLIACVGVLILVLCIYFFTRLSIIKRILHLAASADCATQGDYSVDFTVASDDEIRSLGNSLGFMVSELKNKLGFAEGVLGGLPFPCGLIGPDFRMLWANKELCELLENRGRRRVSSV